MRAIALHDSNSPPFASCGSTSDLELIRRAQDGDRAAFGLLASRHVRTVLALVRQAVRDEHLAEDAAQEALLIAYRSLGQLAKPASFAAWLYRIAIIQTRVGQPFSQETWDDDWHRLTDSGLFLHVRTTPAIGVPGGTMLMVDLVEHALIKKIEFKGNKAIESAELRKAIKSIEGGRYQRAQVHLDAKKIERLYRGKGFRDANVQVEVQAQASRKHLVAGKELLVEEEVDILFAIGEGQAVSVQRIAFQGNEFFSSEELLKLLEIKPGDLKDVDHETEKKRLVNHYLHNGFLDIQIKAVEVESTQEPGERIAKLRFILNEGPRYYVGRLEIEGNKIMALSPLRTALRLKPGAAFSDLLLEEDAKQIKELYRERGHAQPHVEYERKLVSDPKRPAERPHQLDVRIIIRE